MNVYLIDDGDGWAILDTGLTGDVTRATWLALVAGPLSGGRLTRLIVMHFHPNHFRLAGWLSQTYELPLLTCHAPEQIKPIIPPKSDRAATIRYSKHLYHQRNSIERLFGYLLGLTSQQK